MLVNTKLLACLVMSGLSLANVKDGLAKPEITGTSGLEQRYFFQESLFRDSFSGQLSLYAEPEFYWDLNDGTDSLVIKPFLRVDQRDDERTHADIREFLWTHASDDWELKAGIGKVFWGQVESLHLVDVINQTDFVETIDTEDKLGQPLVSLSLIKSWGTTSFFVLPYFRERAFAGSDGRFRLPLELDIDNPIYESSEEESHVDWAVRWEHTLGAWDIGLSYFDGTAREPLFVPEVRLDSAGNPETFLRPFYPQMQQIGVDILAVVGSWLLKFEGIQRDQLDETFIAVVGGFEYTSVGVFDTQYDIGWLVEYQYDERGELATTAGQNDVLLGTRFVFNDIDGTEFLLGYVQDLDYSDSRSVFMEASSRINDSWKWRLESFLFSSDEPEDFAFFFRRDDYVQFSIEHFF
jgi:hypothetical protein